MGFETLYPDIHSRIITSETPGSVTKCSYEKLELGPAGQPDKLILHYDAMASNTASLQSLLLSSFTRGQITNAPTTAGTWIADNPAIISRPEEEPFGHFTLTCLGLAATKPQAVRWLSASETQSGEDVNVNGVLRKKLQAQESPLMVEVDTVIIGAKPTTNTVGTAATPADAPIVKASTWTSIADPTYHFPNGWILDAVRSSQIGGYQWAWLVTNVYRYQFAFSP